MICGSDIQRPRNLETGQQQHLAPTVWGHMLRQVMTDYPGLPFRTLSMDEILWLYDGLRVALRKSTAITTTAKPK